jgi:hypothetical protein
MTHEHKCYIVKEVYLRMSSYKYTSDDETMKNLVIHLTNIAIQQKDKNFGAYEDGKVLS